jgi:hypothetical protein
MIEYVINKRRVKVYDSIEELPIVNFQKYNKFMLIDSIIGSDVQNIDIQMLKATEYIRENKLDLAVMQIENIRHSMHLVNQEISAKYLAFTALIAEIDGQKQEDLSDSHLMNILTQLNAERKTLFDKILDVFKKKVDAELSTYFPKSQNDSFVKELYTKLKYRTSLELDSLINDIDNTLAINKLDVDLLLANKPKIFGGPDSFEVRADKQFNDLCLLISRSLNVQVKTLTVFEFYNALDFIEKENTKKKFK